MNHHPTPRKVPATRRALKTLPAALLMGAIGAAVGFGAAWLLGSGSPESAPESFSLLTLVLDIVLVFAALVLVIVWHETGHAIGGLLAGFRFHFMIVGPMKLEVADGRPRLSLNRSATLAGGLTLAVPLSPPQRPTKMLPYVLGGPVASLLLGLGLGGALLGGWSAPDLVATPVIILALASLAIGVVTLIPARTSGFMTDGAQARVYLRGGDKARTRMAILALVARSYTGTRPRDWPDDLLQDLRVEASDPLEQYSRASYRYMKALDEHRVEEAADWLDALRRSVDELPEPVARTVHQEAAFFAAAVQGDSAAAGRLLSGRSAKPSPLDPTTCWRALAVLHHRAGNESERDKARGKLEEELARSHDRGLAEAQRDWVDRAFADSAPFDGSFREGGSAQAAP